MSTPVSLVGAASFMPPTIVDNAFFGIDERRTRIGMFRGSKERRHMLEGETGVGMIAKASLKLGERLGLTFSKDVDLILTNVSLPDSPFTGAGASVSKILGCQPKWILDLHNTGCVSFVYMIAVARELMASGAIKTALIACAQTSAGRVFRHEENRVRPQSSVPGDGCGVGYLVANDSSPIRSVVQRSYNEYADDMQPKTDDERAYWEPHRQALHIDFTEKKIANVIGRGNALVPGMIREACQAAELDPKQIDALITNQPNSFFLRNWREALELPKEKQIETFEEFGNLFGAAIPVGIERGMETGRIAKGSRVALGGFSHAGDYAAAAIWNCGGQGVKLVDALVWALGTWDTRYVFGVSGANIEHLHDAIVRSNGRVTSVLARSEVGAAFMADARARTTRTLGVCCATSGGGMMNLAVGLAESHAEHVPVLAIVGQIPSTLEGRGGFQDSSPLARGVHAERMFRSITKFTARLTDPDAFWDTLTAAVREALTGVQGPAVLLVPRDLYEREVPDAPKRFPRSLAELMAPPDLDAAAARSLMEEIRHARHPVFVVGRAAEAPGCRDELIELVTRARIPVATTMGSPAAFPNDHPMYLGCVGAAGHPSAHDYLNETCDLVIAVGTELDVMTRQPWLRGLERARVVAVASDTKQVERNVKTAVSVRGAPAHVVQALNEMYDLRPFTLDYEEQPLRRYVTELAARSNEDAGPRDGLLQSEAIAALESHLPDRGHVFFDAGNCAAASIHGMRLPRETSGFIALGMGGMGYAIAGAIGAQLGARAGQRTVVLCGDGAFLMVGLEIHTAVELRLPILFVVFNNGKHGMCVTRQNAYFAGRVDCTEYTPIDVSITSRGLGNQARLWVGRARTGSELAAALAEFEADPFRPGVLELVLEREEIPPFAPFLRADAPTYEVPSVARGVHRAA